MFERRRRLYIEDDGIIAQRKVLDGQGGVTDTVNAEIAVGWMFLVLGRTAGALTGGRHLTLGDLIASNRGMAIRGISILENAMDRSGQQDSQ
jgi:hypothetical protein